MNHEYIGPGRFPSETMKMAGISWVLKRFLPVLLITLGASIGLAFFRASQVFLIGLQGMLAGGVLGWIAGRIGRKDPGVYWSFQQRCWLGVSVTVVYLAAHLVALSWLKAGPVDTPLYWLGEVVRGFHEEHFVSTGRFQGYQGKIEGGWWVVMTVVDAGLFWFLFIALCVVGVCPDRKAENNAPSGAVENPPPDVVDWTQEHDANGALIEPKSRTAFFSMLFVIVGLAVSGGLYWQFADGAQPEMTFSSGIAAMKQYEGLWRFKKGRGLFHDDADARSFTIMALGFGSLSLKGATGNFMLSLDQDGRNFRGLLFMTRQTGGIGQFSVRVRFAPNGNTLTMSVVNFQIGGRRDIVLEAEKISDD
ncbi:MAG: hypothetical protein JXM79_11645 [Sedimentisphaerales bacterium]|nr:hypothetical protein [Sedimentisphaerales bacterium]